MGDFHQYPKYDHLDFPMPYLLTVSKNVKTTKSISPKIKFKIKYLIIMTFNSPLYTKHFSHTFFPLLLTRSLPEIRSLPFQRKKVRLSVAILHVADQKSEPKSLMLQPILSTSPCCLSGLQEPRQFSFLAKTRKSVYM